MTDYLTAGKALRARMAIEEADGETRVAETANNLIDHLTSDEGYFNWAARAHARGERSDLIIDYLRSERPLGRAQRDRLADELEGKYPAIKVSGRPADDDLHLAVLEAECFYRNWKSENEKQGIADRGHSGDMKKFAVETIIELRGYKSVSVEKALDLWARPNKRRK
ncbi:MAG: hypothetical protein JSR61_02710 [Proteobacteria bacterium]|nr:hypothetical protein [Pseudomonadota bacterium]